MAKFLPLIGEVYTAIESTALLISSGVAKLADNDEKASDLLRRAGKSWVDYSETSLLTGMVIADAHAISGNQKEADRRRKKVLDSGLSCLDGMPVVGHAKGIVHYIAGDKEKGNACMEAATRTTAVVGAGLLTGGLGTAVTMTAGVTAGITYDTVLTAAEIIKDPQADASCGRGVYRLCDEDVRVEDVVGIATGVVMDGYTGKSAGRLGAKLKVKGTPQDALHQTYKESGTLKKATNVSPRKATKLTMEAAKASKEAAASLTSEIDYATTVIDDGHTKVSGHSAHYRKTVIIQNEYPDANSSVKAMNKAMKKAGKKVYSELSELQKEHPDVKQVDGKGKHARCAEHHARTNLKDANPAYDSKKIKMATVYSEDGLHATKERCVNCMEYQEKMGRVVTDHIKDGTPVPAEEYINDRLQWKHKTAMTGCEKAANSEFDENNE